MTYTLLFQMFIQKLLLFPKQMQDILARNVSVTLFGQDNHAHGRAQTLQSLKIPLRLQGERARIVVGFAMNKQ